MPKPIACAVFVLSALLVAGCQFPRDPEGTLNRVEGGTMRVGIAVNEPWVRVEAGNPGGVEVKLIEGFARKLDARIDWTEGSEESLMKALKEGQLDVVLAGLTSKSPYKKEASLTRPYIKPELVIGVPPGATFEDDLEGVEVAVEAGSDAGGLVERKTDATLRRVQQIGEVRDKPAAVEDFFLEDLGLTRHGDRLEQEKHVMAVRLGENAFLVELERYLLNADDEIDRLLAEERP